MKIVCILFREFLRDQMVNGFERRYADIMNEWKLAPDDAEKLYPVGGDWAMRNLTRPPR